MNSGRDLPSPPLEQTLAGAMNEPTTAAASPEFPRLKSAVRLGAALLVGLALALIFVRRDNARRSTLEVVTENTAVGDTRYLAIPNPEPPTPFPAAAQLDGRPLIPTSYKRHSRHETDMRLVAHDSTSELRIYQEPVRPKRASNSPEYFLKTGPGTFVKATTTP